MAWRRVLHPAVLAVGLALAVATFGWAGCTQEPHDQSDDEQAATVGGQPAVPGDLQRERAAGPPVRIGIGEGVRLEPPVQAELAEAARRFSTSLAGWLYGRRRETDVEPVVPDVRRGLARSPPYVPHDQFGAGDWKPVAAQVFVQTSRSGALAVVIRDSRTSYPIRASFERRAGRWLIVHLNTH